MNSDRTLFNEALENRNKQLLARELGPADTLADPGHEEALNDIDAQVAILNNMKSDFTEEEYKEKVKGKEDAIFWNKDNVRTSFLPRWAIFDVCTSMLKLVSVDYRNGIPTVIHPHLLVPTKWNLKMII